jgi:hypothetical protein
MVETPLRKGCMLLLQSHCFTKRAYHGPYCSDRTWRQEHKKQRGSIVQGLQQQKKTASSHGMGAALSSWMIFFMHFFKALSGYMCVNLGCGDIDMTKHCLDSP